MKRTPYRAPAKQTLRLQIVLSPELRERIIAAADERKMSLGALVREAVEKMLGPT